MTPGSLWNYYRDKIDNDNCIALDGKSFKCKTKIIEKSPERPPQLGNREDIDRLTQPLVPSLNIGVSILLKYLSNFWRSFVLPLINCEVQVGLMWTKDCVLKEHHNNITGVNLMISSTKLYFPIVILSLNNNIKLLENLKNKKNKRIIYWNKYRSEVTTQPKNNNLDYNG